MQIPYSYNLTTSCLGRVFNNTSATYKYYWLISILQILAKEDKTQIDVWDIVIRMVANAWYPIHFTNLSFGKNDSLYDIVTDVQIIAQIPFDATVEQVVDYLNEEKDNMYVKNKIKILTYNVPYRFLSPWIHTASDKEMVERSLLLENNCLYSLHKDITKFYIEINIEWLAYLRDNYKILMDFAYWNLSMFLQVRNPNVPAIPSKLVKPSSRNSLTAQHNYWDKVIAVTGPIQCIYTGKEIYAKQYDLDHFIPWSFVSHDLLWNLIPADRSINSSKSNKLPELDVYLSKLAYLQHNSLKAYINAGFDGKILDDFTSLGYTARELYNMGDDNFHELLERTFNPLNQIAQNMGFEIWKY